MQFPRLRSLTNLFRVDTSNMELVRAQFTAFLKQIPLLYLIVVINTLAVAWVYAGRAPQWLALYVPGGLCSICASRIVWWWRTRHKTFSDQYVVSHLKLTTSLSVALTLGFTAWGLALYAYGDAYAQGQLAFFLAMTVIGCVFCLMHLKQAALAVTVCANTPFIIFFMAQPHVSLRAMAINLALVSVAMIAVQLVYSRDFARLVASQAETRRLSDDNFRIANVDSLTGLANRRWFFAELGKTFEAAKAEGKGFAIGVIDLDGFKPVNDTYGHSTGDRVLVEAARRLKEACGDTIILARLGGDEFGFIMTRDPGESSLRRLGVVIRDTIARPYSIGAAHAVMGCSIGVALYPVSAADPETLFECADYALYHAKRTRRGQMVLFSTEHEAQIRSHGRIEQALQNADLEHELSLCYQPICDLRTGRPLAFEALARWHSPVLGEVSPGQFIPVAERAGLIRSLTKVLLTKALAAARTWPEDVRISFNLSTHDVCSAESVVQLIALVNRSGVSPRRIDFEITETAVSYDFDQAHRAVLTLKALGVGISLDDFGTGFSSLSHVHRLPLDKLKVDRSFITDINSNPASLKIVKSLTALCADMNLTCIIEGVESEDQLSVLRDLGCTLVQGYLYARPMTEDTVLAYLGTADKRRARG